MQPVRSISPIELVFLTRFTGVTLLSFLSIQSYLVVKTAIPSIKTFAAPLEKSAVFLDHLFLHFFARSRRQWIIFDPLIRSRRVDDGAGAEAFFIFRNHRVKRAAPGAPDKVGVVGWIRTRAHRPHHVVDVVGVDVVVDDDDVTAQVGAGAALSSDKAGLLGVAGIA